MNTINSLRFFLIVILAAMWSCSDKDCSGAVADPISEVRAAQAKIVDDKAVVTWIDPYIKNIKNVIVKDMQTGQQESVAKGVQQAQFSITNNDQSKSYQFELKVETISGQLSQGITVRIVNNWAQKLHPLIDYNSQETPQSGLFFKNKPASELDVFDVRKDESLAKVVTSVMQGIVNQEFAKTYLIWEDQHLDQLNDAGCDYQLISAPQTNNPGFTAFYNKYKDVFNKLIVWNPDDQWTWCIAQMMSAQEHAIPVTEELKNYIINDLGGWNKEIVDIRGRWANKNDAYNWAIDNLAANCHKTLCFSAGLRGDYVSSPWKIYDYAAASKGFVFWLNETNESDKTLMERIFNKIDYPVGSSVLGFGMNTIGDDLNLAINTHNLGFVVSDYYANASFWCSYPNKSFQQRKGIAGEVQPGKVYVSISLSDGDNIQYAANILYRIFKEGKRRGEVPVAVTMPAVLQELNPNLLEFFYKNMTQNDELTAGPSGMQFIFGDKYALSGKYDEWLALNKKWLSTAGFHTAHLWSTDNQANFKQYMEGSGLDLVMDGSSRTNAEGANYKYVNGTVRIDQGEQCSKEGDVYRALLSTSPSERRPIFKNIYILVSDYGVEAGKVVMYERLIKELEKLDRDYPNTYEYMLPMDLAATIKKYIQEGGIY